MNNINLLTSIEKSKIMIVDDNITNLTVAKKALEDSYNVIPVTSGQKAINLLSKVKPALILLDIEMPEMNGFETLLEIKKDDMLKDIPVIFLTAKDDAGSELEGFKLGAVDYIIKPFSIPLLIQRVQLHIKLVAQNNKLQEYNENLTKMVEEKTETISELQDAIRLTFIDLVERRDGLTGGHVARTQEYLKLFVDAILKSGEFDAEMKNVDVDILLASCQLHDIGKISIPDNILSKPARLTLDEFEIIKTHTTAGEEAIKNAMEMVREKKFLMYAATVAISHHEKWDGTGYPHGLKGTDIPFTGRLMAIADVYDALVSERTYKEAYTHKEAIEIIQSESNTRFDPRFVEVFTNTADKFQQAFNSF